MNRVIRPRLNKIREIAGSVSITFNCLVKPRGLEANEGDDVIDKVFPIDLHGTFNPLEACDLIERHTDTPRCHHARPRKGPWRFAQALVAARAGASPRGLRRWSAREPSVSSSSTST